MLFVGNLRARYAHRTVSAFELAQPRLALKIHFFDVSTSRAKGGHEKAR